MTVDFSGKTTPPAPVDDKPTDAPVNQGTSDATNADQAFVFEHNGRQFTKTDLIKKLESADSFIETLKAERAEDRALIQTVSDKLKEQVSAAELLAKVKAANESNATSEQPATTQKPEDIKAQVLAQLKADSEAAKLEENWKSVTAKLGEVYKDKANEKVALVAAENGLTLEQAASLARTSPSVFLKLFPDLTQSPKPSALHSGRGASPTPPPTQQGNSGFGATRTTKEAVSIYLQRLQELSGR